MYTVLFVCLHSILPSIPPTHPPLLFLSLTIFYGSDEEPLESTPPPPGTKFTIRPPPGTPASATPLGTVAAAAVDPIPVWWAVGRDLPSTPLISTRPLPCRRPVAGTGAAAPPRRAAAVATAGGGETVATAPRSLASSVNDGGGGPEAQGVTQGERGRGGAGSATVEGEDRPQRRQQQQQPRQKLRARASIDRSLQRVLDLEMFISQLLRKPEAFAGERGAGPGAVRGGKEGRSSENGGGCGEEAGSSGGVRRGSVQSAAVGEGGCRSVCASALATDYHCVTVGLVDGGRRVSRMAFPSCAHRGNRGGGGGGGVGGRRRYPCHGIITRFFCNFSIR